VALWGPRRWPRPGPKTRPSLGARYRRLVPRLGKKKTIVAVEHSILTAVWHMLTHDVDYHELGGDYFTRLDPDRALNRIIRQANALGFTVRFDPIQAA
jgi:transposase